MGQLPVLFIQVCLPCHCLLSLSWMWRMATLINYSVPSSLDLTTVFRQLYPATFASTLSALQPHGHPQSIPSLLSYVTDQVPSDSKIAILSQMKSWNWSPSQLFKQTATCKLLSCSTILSAKTCPTKKPPQDFKI